MTETGRPLPASSGDPAAQLAGAATEPPPEAAPAVFDEAEGLSVEEVKRRASAGVSIVASRGLAILLLSTVGGIVLARLLTPHDFGLVAVGMSVVLFTGLVSDGGLGAGLIRRPEPPRREELEALTGFQVAISGALALICLAIAPFAGKVGWVTAVMVASMPITVLQFPGKILLERTLSYGAVAVVEVAQVVTYQAWAITFVAVGFGVWGLATATIAMRVVAAIVIARVSPVGAPRMRLSWRLIKPLLGFGLRFQAISGAWLARDQGLNVSIAAIASVATLGLFSLVRRLLEIPYLIFTTLFRVSFPTMSRLVARGEDTAGLIERGVGMAAVGTGIILVALAGSARGLVPGVFGEKWGEASSILPLACLGLGIGGSVSVATQGYLYAIDDAAAVLRSVVLQTIALFAVTVPLLALSVLGVKAIGLGLLVSFVVEALVLTEAMRRHLAVRLLRPLLAPAAAGIVAGAIGWYVSGLGHNQLLAGIAGGLCSAACFVGILSILRWKLVRETLGFAMRSVRAAA
jgi:O-antigen/teichoic acid export membrane protein